MQKVYLPEMFNGYLFIQYQINLIQTHNNGNVPEKLLHIQHENQKHLFQE